ncbi:hypothetical protein E5206_14495 [Arthrobacter sp. PAMC25564]|uniref:hypothetical protein n=1 Tax=Arthrobacter sp. PAMC25564 TaxID=2565366 RepID=UPI0010A21F87|nr:hypothetical protein [Arthrobacter sp. PAMC25564]QCB97972.1 hypothetical protein E5206_14495 [Arthrobacter sp. PAMC25564]
MQDSPYEDAVAVVLALILANDAMDADVVSAAFESDGILRFGNGREARGAARVRRSLESFFGSLSGVCHEVLGVTTGTWSEGTVVSVQAEVTYTRLDGSTVGPLPVTSTVHLTGQRTVARYQIYIDPSPLSATAEPAASTVEETR